MEADIILIYGGCDDKVHVDLIEVKSRNKNIQHRQVEDALEQVRKDALLVLALLKDFSKDKMVIQTFIAFPYCDQAEIFCKDSLKNVILKSDLQEESLSRKLNLKKRQWSEFDNIAFLSLCARLIGRGIEKNSNISIIEAMIKYENNIEKQLIMLDEEQIKVLNYLEYYYQ